MAKILGALTPAHTRSVSNSLAEVRDPT